MRNLGTGGNLFVNTDTGVVTFLDCGMVGELTMAQRAHMVVLLWTFVAGDIPAMAGQLRSLSMPFRPVDDKAFARAFEHKMSRCATWRSRHSPRTSWLRR